MLYYTWNFGVLGIYRDAILNGAIVTIEITAMSLIFGTALGLILCLGKISKNTYIRIPTSLSIEVFTGLPLLVLLVWLYYAMPILVGVRFSPLVTAILGLTINLGGFSAEIFRAGVEAIENGQVEAAFMLGFTKIQNLRYIVLPQALKIVLPALSGRYIETIKLTSLASIISAEELLHTGENIISVSFRPLEVYTAIAVIYLAIILPLTSVLRKLGKTL